LTRYRLEVRVIPRPGLLDPEGKAIHHSLDSLDYEGVGRVRVGKAILLDLDAPSSEAAISSAEDMCRRLLANPVTEEFSIELLSEVAEATG